MSDRQAEGRSAVLTAAALAFTTRGYSATSIDDIADELGATKGKVYHYFRTKGEIFVGIHRRALELTIGNARLWYEADGSAAERLFGMATGHARLMMDENTLMRVAVQHHEIYLAAEGRNRRNNTDEIFVMRDELESYFRRVVGQGMEAGEFAAGNASLMAKAVLGELNWVSVWYRQRPSDTPEGRQEVSQDLGRFALNGLGLSAAGRRGLAKALKASSVV